MEEEYVFINKFFEIMRLIFMFGLVKLLYYGGYGFGLMLLVNLFFSKELLVN